MITLPVFGMGVSAWLGRWLEHSRYFPKRTYADYEEIEEAAMNAGRASVLNPDLMKTACNTPYLHRAVSK
jgi:hypothetical protein